VSAAGAPSETILALLVVFGAAVVIVVRPSHSFHAAPAKPARG
jgi:hypothetical protein